ncbi:MAG: hypothetical protein WAU56_18705 [Steroidobacteraceae bacterium]
MKRLVAAFALSTLAAATIGLAQQATQQAPAQPSASPSQATTPSDPGSASQAASPSNPGAGHVDKQALMKDCMTQVQAANPTVAAKDIQTYCDEQVKKIYATKPE